MGELEKSAGACVARIRSLLVEARGRALQSVNTEMVAAYWHIGREIVEEEQRGGKRAGYGERLIAHLAARLTAEFGKGFAVRNLHYFRLFYSTYRDRRPEILHALRAKSSETPGTAFLPGLSWTPTGSC